MTPTTQPRTVTIIRDGEHEVLDERMAAIFAKLLEPEYRALIEREWPLHITLDCKGKGSVVLRVTVGG